MAYNPNFNDFFLQLLQTTVPANPPSGQFKVYFKNDGKMYSLNSSGSENTIGASIGNFTFSGDTINNAIGAPSYTATNPGSGMSWSTVGTTSNVTIPGSFTWTVGTNTGTAGGGGFVFNVGHSTGYGEGSFTIADPAVSATLCTINGSGVTLGVVSNFVVQSGGGLGYIGRTTQFYFRADGIGVRGNLHDDGAHLYWVGATSGNFYPFLGVAADTLVVGATAGAMPANISGTVLAYQITTPGSNPPSGSNYLYFKNNNNLYSLNSSGIEVQVGNTGNFTFSGDTISNANPWVLTAPGTISNASPASGFTFEVQHNTVGDDGHFKIIRGSDSYSMLDIDTIKGATFTGSVTALAFGINNGSPFTPNNLLDLRKTTATAGYAQWTNSVTGNGAANGLLVGIDASGAALVQQQDRSAAPGLGLTMQAGSSLSGVGNNGGDIHINAGGTSDNTIAYPGTISFRVGGGVYPIHTSSFDISGGFNISGTTLRIGGNASIVTSSGLLQLNTNVPVLYLYSSVIQSAKDIVALDVPYAASRVSLGADTVNNGMLPFRTVATESLQMGYIYNVDPVPAFPASGTIKVKTGTNLTLVADSTVLPTAGAASSPALNISGAPFTGGSSTTTKPLVLLEDTGNTSAGWSTAGTYLGVNTHSGFTGNIVDLQINGVSQFSVTSAGVVAGVGSGLTALNGSNISSGTVAAARVAQINLATSGNGGVTGTLPIANGGTGQTTAAAAFDALSPLTTQGDVLYYNGTHNVRLGPGTNGQVLTSGGAAANPSWTTAVVAVTTVGTFSGASQANGASISSNTITFGPADATNPGMVQASGAQTLGINATFNAAGAASLSAIEVTGTPFSGTSTTSKPIVLIEDSGNTSTTWGTAGTYFGINTKVGTSMKAIDIQYSGTSTSVFSVDGFDGSIVTATNMTVGKNIVGTATSQTYISGQGSASRIRLFGSSVDLISFVGSLMDDTGNFNWLGGWKGNYTQPWVRAYIGTEGLMVGNGNQASSPIAPYQLLDVRGIAGAAQTVYSNTSTGAADSTHGLAVGIDSSGNGILKNNTSGKTTAIYSNRYYSKETGSNDNSGTGTLVAGTATITTTAATGTYRVFITDTTTGALTNVGSLNVTAKNSGNFVVTSTNILDTSTFDWLILNTY